MRPASSLGPCLLLALATCSTASPSWSASAQAPRGAALRVDAFPTSVTASGHPMSAWVTVSNDSERLARVEVRAARSLDGAEDSPPAPPSPLRIHAVEVEDARVDHAFVVPAHASVRVVVFVGGFEGRARGRYDVALDVCLEGGPCVEGRTHVTRAHRDPIRR